MKTTAKTDQVISVQSGIKPPPFRFGRGTLYPWKSMNPGDSFFVPVDVKDHTWPLTLKRKQSVLYTCGRRFFKKLMTRREGNGIRVWRIE